MTASSRREPDYRTVIVALENGETGVMETLATVPRDEHGAPLWPGDPDRHDAGAGDRLDVRIVPLDWTDDHGHGGFAP